jgi:eukaryotic translation initiation factor 2C
MGNVWRKLNLSQQTLATAFLLQIAKEKKAAASAASTPAQNSTPVVTEPIIPPANVSNTASSLAENHDPYATVPTDTLQNIHDRSLVEPIETALPASSPAPRSTEISPGHVLKPANVTPQIDGTPYPQRKVFAEPTSEVLANYFEVGWKPDTKFYVYELLDVSAGRSKRQTKSIVKTVIQAWGFLKDNQDFFTTDYLKMIVSWKNLHDAIQCPRKNVLNETVWLPEPLADGDRCFSFVVVFLFAFSP